MSVPAEEPGPPCTGGPAAYAMAQGRWTRSHASAQANCFKDGKYQGVEYGHWVEHFCVVPQPDCPATSESSSDSVCRTCLAPPWSSTRGMYGQFWDASTHTFTDSHAFASL